MSVPGTSGHCLALSCLRLPAQLGASQGEHRELGQRLLLDHVTQIVAGRGIDMEERHADTTGNDYAMALQHRPLVLS